jgi:hypothetical protein
MISAFWAERGVILHRKGRGDGKNPCAISVSTRVFSQSSKPNDLVVVKYIHFDGVAGRVSVGLEIECPHEVHGVDINRVLGQMNTGADSLVLQGGGWL